MIIFIIIAGVMMGPKLGVHLGAKQGQDIYLIKHIFIILIASKHLFNKLL